MAVAIPFSCCIQSGTEESLSRGSQDLQGDGMTYECLTSRASSRDVSGVSMTQLCRSAHSTLRLSISCAFLLSDRPPTTCSCPWLPAPLLLDAAAAAPLRWLEGRGLLGGLELEKLTVALRPRPLCSKLPPCSRPLLCILPPLCSSAAERQKPNCNAPGCGA